MVPNRQKKFGSTEYTLPNSYISSAKSKPKQVTELLRNLRLLPMRVPDLASEPPRPIPAPGLHDLPRPPPTLAPDTSQMSWPIPGRNWGRQAIFTSSGGCCRGHSRRSGVWTSPLAASLVPGRPDLTPGRFHRPWPPPTAPVQNSIWQIISLNWLVD